jgi:predicted nucleic acid-binding protein
LTEPIWRTAPTGSDVPVGASGVTQVAERVVVDTDILIDAARMRPEATDVLQSLSATAELCVSVVTEMELVVGCQNKAELRALDTFLDRFRVEPVTERVSAGAVGLLRRYRLSHGLLIADALIASTAIGLECRLLTKNQRDFAYIRSLAVIPYP